MTANELRISDWSSDVCASDLVTHKNRQTTVTVRDSTGAPATALINVAEAKAKGFEAELTVRPVEGLMLNATWGYIDCKITKTTPVAQAQRLPAANRLTKTPKNKISLAAPYRSEEHPSALQSLMRSSSAVFCLRQTT